MNGCEIIVCDTGDAWANCRTSTESNLIETMCEFFKDTSNTYPQCVYNKKFPQCTCITAIEKACAQQGIDTSVIWNSIAEEKLDDI